MALQIAGQVQKGIFPSLASGSSSQPLTQGQYAEAMVSELNARYANLVLTGQVFGVTFASGAVAAASATATGTAALFNPAGSGLNLVLLAVNVPTITFTAGTTGAGFGLQLVGNQTPTTVTAGNVAQNLLVGASRVSVAKTFIAGTLVGASTVIGYGLGGAYLDLAAGNAYATPYDIGGAVIIAPNSGVCLVSTGTLTVSAAPSFMWAELPI